LRPAVQLGSCLALVLLPLLLLATPQRAALHIAQHPTGADAARHGVDASLTGSSPLWTIPVVVTDLIRSTPATTTTHVDPPVSNPRTRVVNVSYRQVLPTTTTTTRPPPPATTIPKVVTPAPKPVPVVTTTTTRPPPPPTTTAPPQNTTTGQASWYGATPGTCASPSLPFGTVVTVTDLATGASVRCTVDDREAHTPGRVLDMAEATFSQLASPSVGVIEVRLSW
jgi:rare lipoprotein A (peptidoglycan hydrolase)